MLIQKRSEKAFELHGKHQQSKLQLNLLQLIHNYK